MDKFSPYLAYLPENDVPELVGNAKDFKSDLMPTINNWAQYFTNIRSVQLRNKLHPKKHEEVNVKSKQSLNRVRVANKPTVLSPIVQDILSGEYPDTVVLVGDRQFACNGLVLSTYSAYFKRQRGRTEIDLRQTPVNVKTFDYIYKWMIKSINHMQSKNLVEIMRAGYYLEIQQLLQLCFTLLDGDRFKELDAFQLMHQMRSYDDLYAISEGIASRISTCALLVMCSVQFLTISDVQLCQLLRSSFLAVNSETEIFFCSLLWLNANWPARSSHVLQVLKCIRYAYISPTLLCQLNEADYERIGPFGRVLDEFLKLPEALQLIEDGIFYSTLVITMNGDASQLKDVPHTRNELMIPRRWMQDIRCRYHRAVSKLCPNMRYITYDNFAEYSETLQASNCCYEEYIKYPSDDKEIEVNYNNKNNDTALKSMQAKRETKCEQEIDSHLNEECIQLRNPAHNLSSSLTATRTCFNSFPKHFKPSKHWATWEKVTFRNANESNGN